MLPKIQQRAYFKYLHNYSQIHYTNLCIEHDGGSKLLCKCSEYKTAFKLMKIDSSYNHEICEFYIHYIKHCTIFFTFQ